MSDTSKQYLPTPQPQQQQPQPPATVPSLPSSSSMNSNGSPPGPPDGLTCQWAACRDRCESPEALYDHVCERHVGRKSTNNLSLTCQWGSCRTTTVKRDHITSHIRVHVPLKPHKCDFCGKSFKRPQDLKKHVKTHADETVLSNGRTSESANQPRQMLAPSSSYQVQSKQNYYPTTSSMPQQHSSYGYPTQGGSSYGGYYNGQPTTAGTPSYGPVHYSMPAHQNYSMQGSRKRGNDDLNSFFGDVKHRRVDPMQYQDLGSRFGDIGSLGFGGMSGFDNGMMDAGGVAMHTAHHPTSFSPFSELRTKNDLHQMDSFLDQLSHTVYNQEQSILGGGILAPITSMATQYRTSHSPPHMQAPVSYNTSISSASGTPYSSTIMSHADDRTPALTPSSYQASASPSSSANHASPVSRPHGVSVPAAYPTLPSFSTLPHPNANMTAPGYHVPVSSLGSMFDNNNFEDVRRYSGGRLQRAAPEQTSVTPTSPTEDSRRSSTATELAKGFHNLSAASPVMQTGNNGVKLPGVADITRTPSQRSSDSEGAADEAHEIWIRNTKVVEMLKQYVKERLEKGEYAEDDVEMEGARSSPAPQVKAEAKQQQQEQDRAQEHIEPSLRYPSLKAEMTA